MGEGFIYCDTAASTARGNAQTALGDEMHLKSTLGSLKRVSAKPTAPTVKPTRPETLHPRYPIHNAVGHKQQGIFDKRNLFLPTEIINQQ